MQEFGKYIERRLVQLHLTQVTVAPKVRLSQQAVSKWVRGKQAHINTDQLTLWATALETDEQTLRRILGKDAPVPLGKLPDEKSVRQLVEESLSPGAHHQAIVNLIQRQFERMIRQSAQGEYDEFVRWAREVPGAVDAALVETEEGERGG